MSAGYFSLACRLETIFPLLIMIAEIVLNALTASALDRTTVSPHSYPIEQIKL